jgi:hypothetical protein
MLWAETKPVLEERTDLGEISPVIVASSLNLKLSDSTSAEAGIALANIRFREIAHVK